MVRTAILLILCTSAAQAAMPRYAVEAYCEEIAGFGGTYSSEMYNFCIDSEQDAYDALKPRWDAVSPRVQAYCDEIARFGSPGSYEMLKFCVEQETQAETNKKSFQY